MAESPKNPRKKIVGGKGKMKGNETGIPFGHGQPQPSNEAKKAGWDKRKKGKMMIQAFLELPFKGAKDKALIKDMCEYFGFDAENITNEVMLVMRQIEKAIKKNDTVAFQAIMDRVYGRPKQTTEITKPKVGKELADETYV